MNNEITVRFSYYDVKNKKSGRTYRVLSEKLIDCNNAGNNGMSCLYTDGKKLFSREKKEFSEKFERINNERC